MNSISGSPRAYYDAFINFRGADTRPGFVSVLCDKLKRAGVWFFYDDEWIPKCEPIANQLKEAIDISHIYITIFSKKYGDSKWCLRELTQMNDLRKSNGKFILPIFYDVEVQALKLDGDIYSKVDQHNADAGTVEAWRSALVEVARLKGLELRNAEHTKFCDEVVAVILDKLKNKYYMYNPTIGLEGKVKEIKQQLQLDCSDVRFLAIYGPSGVGKTTLAKDVFKQFSRFFEGHCFIEDIGSHPDGYKYLKRQLPLNILGKEEGEGKSIKQCFRLMKVLIVLDNVDMLKQIEKLQCTWFGPGSRIIITTELRREQLQDKGFCVFEMTEMKERDALELFSRRAFGKNEPPKAYARNTRNIMQYISELPLTIEIVGSYLRREADSTWSSTLKQLIDMSTTPDVVAAQMIEKSFEKLNDEDEKPIFLDIACFLANKETTNAMYMWKDHYQNAEAAVQNLVASSLVKIENDKFLMHDRVREFGRNNVLAEAVGDPGQRSRLWNHKEALNVLERHERKEKVQGLCLKNSESLKGSCFSGAQMEMKILRFFRLYFGSVSGDLKHLKELRWFSWNHSPNYLAATSFHCGNLVILDLSDSFITHEWKGWRLLQKATTLKVLDLKRCKELKETPNLSGFKKLERLILEGCSALATISDSICDLGDLKCLNAKGCDSLVKLPSRLDSLTALTELLISKTESISVSDQDDFTLPESIGSLGSLLILEIVNVKIHQLPSMEGLKNLRGLSLFGCSQVNQLPLTIGKLESLVKLDISRTKIATLPDSVRDLHKLEVMIMEDSSVTVLPSSIWMLKNLKKLFARNSRSLGGQILDLGSGDGIFDPTNMSPLRILDLSSTRITELSWEVRELSLLEILRLDSCDDLQSLVSLPRNLTSLHIQIGSLHNIQHLLSAVNNLEDLVIVISSNSPPNMEARHRDDWNLTKFTKLRNLELTFLNFADFQPSRVAFPELKMLKLSDGDLEDWRLLPDSLSKLVLKNVKVGLPNSAPFPNLPNMSFLKLDDCTITGNIFRDGMFESLVHFSADRCRFEKVELLCPPISLRGIRMNQCEFLNTVLDLSGLKDLQQLELQNCNEIDVQSTWRQIAQTFAFRRQKGGLKKIQGLEKLDSLQELTIKSCDSLEMLTGINSGTLQSLCLEIDAKVLTPCEKKILIERKFVTKNIVFK